MTNKTTLGESHRAKWIYNPNDTDASPYFRREFYVEKSIKNASVQICGVGYYELRINGEKPDDRILTPAYTKYDKSVLYDTYDVTHLLKKGKNVIAVLLGNGYFNNNIKDAFGFWYAPWNNIARFICTLTADGEEILVSNSKFKTSTGGIYYNSLRVGECFDARLEPWGWDTVGFCDSAWEPAKVGQTPGGILRDSDNLPVRIIRKLKPVASWKTGEGTTVYDFGENITGFVCMAGKAKRGVEVVFHYGERLKDKRVDQEEIRIYVYEDEFQSDHYTFGGSSEESWQPKFVYHGFQYIELFGGENAEIDVSACVIHSDIKKAGEFSCSSPILCKIQDCVNRSTIMNFVHMPMDCPHREKLGWTGDAQLCAEQTLLNYDAKDFYLLWLKNYPEAQRPGGQIPAVIPTPIGGHFLGHSGPAWDCALFVIPWNIYLYTGDKRAIELLYDTCKRYLYYTDSMAENFIIDFGHGDWTALQTMCPSELTCTAYYYVMAERFCRFAAILGKKDDEKEAAELCNNIKRAFWNKYIDFETGIVGDDSQCAYSCVIYQGLLPEELADKIAYYLDKTVEKHNYHIDGGILCAKYLLWSLSEIGRHDLAVRIAENEDFPGWGYMVKNSTTLWENWAGSSSLNHQMYGSISEWFYRSVLGMNPCVTKPGFEHVLLTPHFDGLDFAEGYHDTVFGRITIDWTKSEAGVEYRVTLPGGVSAWVSAPNGFRGDSTHLQSGSHTLYFEQKTEG